MLDGNSCGRVRESLTALLTMVVGSLGSSSCRALASCAPVHYVAVKRCIGEQRLLTDLEDRQWRLPSIDHNNLIHRAVFLVQSHCLAHEW
jgi:hypothetical protein